MIELLYLYLLNVTYLHSSSIPRDTYVLTSSGLRLRLSSNLTLALDPRLHCAEMTLTSLFVVISTAAFVTGTGIADHKAVSRVDKVSLSQPKASQLRQDTHTTLCPQFDDLPLMTPVDKSAGGFLAYNALTTLFLISPPPPSGHQIAATGLRSQTQAGQAAILPLDSTVRCFGEYLVDRPAAQALLTRIYPYQTSSPSAMAASSPRKPMSLRCLSAARSSFPAARHSRVRPRRKSRSTILA